MPKLNCYQTLVNFAFDKINLLDTKFDTELKYLKKQNSSQKTNFIFCKKGLFQNFNFHYKRLERDEFVVLFLNFNSQLSDKSQILTSSQNILNILFFNVWS